MRRALFLAVMLLSTPAVAQDLSRARALDQQGIKAYTEHRYNDAIRYFDEAYRLGGPPFELWNIAKCRIELDQPEEAVEQLEKYLALPNLPADDRKDAKEQLEQLKKRPSTLTVSTSPSGAAVSVDGKPVGKTPLSVSVTPGMHTVAVVNGKRTTNQSVEAKLGRAIILDVPNDDTPGAVEHPEDVHPVNFRAYFGFEFAKYGEVGSAAAPAGVLTANYRLGKIGPAAIAIGGLFHLTHDSWDNDVNAPKTGIANCPNGNLGDSQSATAFAFFFAGNVMVPVSDKIDVGGNLGVGLSQLFAGSEVGGDLFDPSCRASPGGRPAFTIAPQVDYAITKALRLSAMPFAFQLQSAHDGTRTTPVDASSAWMRFTFALGLGLDLR